VIDLADHIERTKIVAMIAADVDAYSVASLTDDPRKHLGASEIGEPCQARLWNGFRWLKQERHSGRMLRLFKRGNREEAHVVGILRGLGFDVRELADDGNQFRIAGVDGHFGGSLDGVAMAPLRYAIGEPLLLEFKTFNAKTFAALVKDGVRIAKPKHFSQMSCYGRAYSLHYALYCAVCKDTDEIHFELVPLDWSHADDMFRKAEGIIRAPEQPRKISQVETYFECKYCHFSGICFRGEKPEKNCRSCCYSKPVEGGKWVCTNPQLDATQPTPLTDLIIPTGCALWEPIVNAGYSNA